MSYIGTLFIVWFRQETGLDRFNCTKIYKIFSFRSNNWYQTFHIIDSHPKYSSHVVDCVLLFPYTSVSITRFNNFFSRCFFNIWYIVIYELWQLISKILVHYQKSYSLGLYVNYIFWSIKICMEWVQIV